MSAVEIPDGYVALLSSKTSPSYRARRRPQAMTQKRKSALRAGSKISECTSFVKTRLSAPRNSGRYARLGGILFRNGLNYFNSRGQSQECESGRLSRQFQTRRFASPY